MLWTPDVLIHMAIQRGNTRFIGELARLPKTPAKKRGAPDSRKIAERMIEFALVRPLRP